MNVVQLRKKAEVAEGHAYHQNWYPVALSSEVTPGALVGKDFLGTRVVVHRDDDGEAIVQTGYCPHLGADLSLGQLVDGRVRCAFHHWSFDKSGQCVHISTGGKIPPGARIERLTTRESLGVIWAFNGETPLYEVPRMPDVDEADLAYVAHIGETRNVEHWLPVSNAVDFQHLRALHNLPFEEPDVIDFGDHVISYSFGEGPRLRTTKIYGTNTFTAHTDTVHQDLFVMTSRTPVAPKVSAGVFVVATRKAAPGDAEGEARVAKMLEIFASSTRKLLAEDAMILDTIRFRPNVLVEADRHLARYFKYVRAYPSAVPLGA